MKTEPGHIFSLNDEYHPLDDLTISGILSEKLNASVFSLGRNTDISKEAYGKDSFLFALYQEGRVFDKDMKAGDVIYLKKDTFAGKKTKAGMVYLEFLFEKENTFMNEKIKAGEVFTLKDLLPYQEGKVINLDVFHNDNGKMAVISMAKGTKLDEHKAPGQALLFILDGEGVIRYEGKEYEVHQGDNFSFAKGGLHGVFAKTDFKFALVLEF